MNRITPNLTGVRATALLTVYERDLDSRSPHPILGDRKAGEIASALDFDFSKFSAARKERYGVAVRTRQMDEWTAAYIGEHPDAVVLDLGCSLDSRVFRVDPPATVTWYDVDYPDVLELRAEFYPPRPGHHTIGTDLNAAGWLEELPADRPVAIVADGTFMFLDESELRRLLDRIVAHFQGGQLAFNTTTSLQVKLANRHPAVRAAGTRLRWGLDDPRLLETFNPALKFAEEKNIIESPWLEHASAPYRATCAVFRSIPAWRAQGGRILRYTF
jgi:O-methyltransferase involved in polyketide biosynthesis